MADGVQGVTTQVLSGLIIGVVVAVASAFVSHLFTRGRDRERWDREAEAQRERWEHEDRIRFQAERLRAYRDYLVGARKAGDSGGEGFDAELMVPLLQEIELVGSSEVAAADIFTYGSQAKHAGQRFHENRESGAKFDMVRLRFEESCHWFTNAATRRLGEILRTEGSEGARSHSAKRHGFTRRSRGYWRGIESRVEPQRPWWRRWFGG